MNLRTKAQALQRENERLKIQSESRLCALREERLNVLALLSVICGEGAMPRELEERARTLVRTHLEVRELSTEIVPGCK